MVFWGDGKMNRAGADLKPLNVMPCFRSIGSSFVSMPRVMRL